MTRIERPNQDALGDAIDIYRDTIRRFIVETLRSLGIAPVEDLISDALGPHSQWFWRELRRHGNVEAAIDIGDFPHIIRRCWDAIFRDIFQDDRNVWNALFLIANARNRVAHPDQEDLEIEYVCAHLFHIAEVLRLIDSTDRKHEVEAIRDDLRKPPTSSTSETELAVELQAPPEPPAEKSAVSTPQGEASPRAPEDPPSDSETAEVNISNIQPGRPISGTFLARHVRRLTDRNRNEYLRTGLYDKSGEWVTARMFSAPEEVFESIRDYTTVNVDGYCQNYQGQMVILIDSIEPAQTEWELNESATVSDTRPGHHVNGWFTARQVTMWEARTGNDYLQTRLYDYVPSGEWVIARWFDAPEDIFDMIRDEMVIGVDGYCASFQGQPVVHIEDLTRADGDINPNDPPF